MITITAKTNPLEDSVVVCQTEPGPSLLEIVGVTNDRLQVTLNEEPVPMECWGDVRPADGDFVRITVVPGAFGIDIAVAVAAAAEAAASAAASVGTSVGAAVGAATGSTTLAYIAGFVAYTGALISPIASLAMSVVSAVVKPQIPSTNFGAPTKNRYYTLTQGTNSAEAWGYVPKLYGKLRITPPLGGQYYTVTRNGEQYLHVLLCLGYGPLFFPHPNDLNDPPNMAAGLIVSGTPNLGQPLLSSRIEQHRDILNPNIMVGDAFIGELSGTWPNTDIDSATIRWQVGTVAAIMNPTNESPIYNADVEEKAVEHKLYNKVDLWYTDNNNRWADEKRDGKYPGEDGASYVITPEGKRILRVQVELNFPALYTMQGETAVTRGGAAVVFRVIYRRTDKVGALTAELSNNLVGVGWDESMPELFAGDQDKKRQHWLVSGESTAPVRRANWFNLIHWNEAAGKWRDGYGDDIPADARYEIRVVRVKTLWAKHVVTTQSDCSWVRTTFHGMEPAWFTSDYHNTDDIILAALQIRATNRVNGNLEPVSFLAQSVVQQVTETGPGGYFPTSNPADIYADIPRGTHIHESSRLNSDQFEWAALWAWRVFCTQGHDPNEKIRIYNYNYYHTDNEPMLDRMRAVATTGRASWALKDGKVSVIRDNEFVPVQMITPRNSWGFEFTKSYPKVPHALRVRWVNPKTWQQDELLVLDDGYRQLIGSTWYTALGTVATPEQIAATKSPTLFEVLETQGVTDKQQAFREGRYFLAAMRMRLETFKVEMDIENIVATRGDCARLTHDALVLARRSGRVISADTVSRTLNLDEPVSFDWPIPEGYVPCLRIRSVDNGIDGGVVGGVTSFFVRLQHPNTDVPQYTVTALAAEAGLNGTNRDPLRYVQSGDLFVFGNLGYEMIDAKITQIDYRADLSATVSMVYAAPDILDADIQDIEEGQPGVIPDPPPELRAPPAPVFISLTASPHDVYLGPDGQIHCKVVVTWAMPQSGARADYVYAFYSVGGGDQQVARAEAGLGTLAISELPINSTVSVFLQSYADFTGRFSLPTEVKVIQTPDTNFFIPLTPSALTLDYEYFQPPIGLAVYRILAQWRVNGFSANLQIAWLKKDRLADNPTPGEGAWLGRELGAGVTSYIIGADLNEDEEDIGAAEYMVAVRNKVLDDPADGTWPAAGPSPWSTWAVAQVTVHADNSPPRAPTNLEAVPASGGIKLTWTVPTNEDDYAGTQIWHSRYNNRDGRYDGNYVPPAELLKEVGLVETWTHELTDTGYHYYWIRGYDSLGQVSGWEKAGYNEGVWAQPGVPGDGAPPLPVTDLIVAQDNWQVLLEWQRPVIPDLLHSSVYWTKSHAREAPFTTDAQILAAATYLGITREKFFSHTSIPLSDIGSTTPTYYHYWVRNDDVEQMHSEFTYVSVEMVWNEANYQKLFSVKQLNAMHIDSRGLTVRDWPTEEDRSPWANETGDGGIVLGSGATSLPNWMMQQTALLTLLQTLGVKNYFRGAVLDRGLVLAAQDGQSPAVVQSYDYAEGQQNAETGYLEPGKGWRIRGDGVAEFEEIKARGELKSNLYNPGRYGWALKQNGDAEFNNGSFRGEISADTLLLGTGYSLMQLAEQATVIQSVNIRGPSAPYFKYDANNNCISNALLQFSLTNAIKATWTVKGWLGGVSTTIVSTTGLELPVPVAYMKKTAGAYYDYLTVGVVLGDFNESVTIHRLTPSTGLKLILSNEIYHVAVDANNTPINYKYGWGYASLFDGVTEIPYANYTLSKLDSNCTTTLDGKDDAKPGFYTVTAIAATSGYSQISATYGATTKTASFVVKKQKSVLIGNTSDTGARFFVFSGDYSDASWANASAIDNLVIAESGTIMARDVVTLVKLATGYSKTGYRGDNGVWLPLTAYVNGDLVVHGTIDTAQLKADAVKAGKIDANAITAREIAAGEIKAVHLAAEVITADKIVSGSIGRTTFLRGWDYDPDEPNSTGLASFSRIGQTSREHAVLQSQGYYVRNPNKLCSFVLNVSFEAAPSIDRIELWIPEWVNAQNTPIVGVELYQKRGGGTLSARHFSSCYGFEGVLPISYFSVQIKAFADLNTAGTISGLTVTVMEQVI